MNAQITTPCRDSHSHSDMMTRSGGLEHSSVVLDRSPPDDEGTPSTTGCSANQSRDYLPEGSIDADPHLKATPKLQTTLGVRWAPLNVPLKRRLQTLVVLVHCLSIAIATSSFFLICANPLCWFFVIIYLIDLTLSTAHCNGKLSRRSSLARNSAIWKLFSSFFPARLLKTAELVPTRKYIFGYHPHGIISHGAWAAFATESLGFADLFPGITNTILTLDSNFRIPFYRDYILAMGLGSVSKESIVNILTTGGTDGEGMGRAVTIVVGGAREALEAQPGNLNLILQGRKGFVRMAAKTGADLVPVLAFGENELYTQVSHREHPTVHRVQMYFLRALKFTLPLLRGRGVFNYDVGLLPFRHPLNIVVGRPIKVALASGAAPPNNEDIDRLHQEYVSELERLWHCYKDQFAPNRKGDIRILN